jgi:hypothetical protein
MSPLAWFLLVGIPLLVVLLVLEGRRQERKHGKGSGHGSDLMRAGLLEVQNLLEPERKVEVHREAERKRDLLVDISDIGDKPSTS